MASEEEQDVFEITDFTTASDWERFIARIEEVIHEWKLPFVKLGGPLSKEALFKGKWVTTGQELTFANFRFYIERTFLKLSEETTLAAPQKNIDEEPVMEFLHDLMSYENDFCIGAPYIFQWYGLRDFVIISPMKGDEVIANESRAKLLISSMCVAINNTNCKVPFFVQLHHKLQCFYLGVCENERLRTNFQMVHLGKVPHQSNNLTRLLEVYKSKLGCPIGNLSPATVSACFTYVIRKWDHGTSWPQQPPDFDSAFPSIGMSELNRLPFGATMDPLKEILVSAIWQRFTEDVVVDNNVHSDLDPIFAPLWRVSLKLVEEPSCLLVEYLSEFCRLVRHLETTDQILGLRSNTYSDDDLDVTVKSALDRLANPVPAMPSVSTVVSETRKRLQLRPLEGPIPEASLKEILFFLFPDAVGKDVDEIRQEGLSRVLSEDQPKFNEVKEQLDNFKLVPTKNLLYSLAICMCHVNHTFGKICAVAHLWHEFVLEMRHRWENGVMIPGIESGPPNLTMCLLHQKLQMLNYCLERKNAREANQSGDRSTGQDGCASSSDEEFYECDDDDDEASDVKSSKSSADDQGSPPQSDFVDSVSQLADGRLLQCGDLRLLQSGDTMYIPVTQEPAPMTEDQLEAHAEVLLQLGTDEDGALLRAQLQSASLQSDMQAFKAANPNCLLEDFVRWYSPRDWIDEGEVVENGKVITKGHLSPRMIVPGNTWQEIWASAKPIPARRQKRLFDDTKEGEKVLHYLASLKPAEIVVHLRPMLIHAAIATLIENDEPAIPVIPSMLKSIATSGASLSKLQDTNADEYAKIVNQIGRVETILSRAKALKNLLSHTAVASNTQLTDLQNFVRSLLENPGVNLTGGSRTPEGKVLLSLFQDSMKDEDMLEHENVRRDSAPKFPSPIKREYVLRCCVPRPAPYSTVTPQRMYCSLVDGDFRLAGAFTQDTTFQ